MEYLHHQQNQEQHQLQQQEVDDETAALNTADWALNFFDSSPRSGGDFSGSVSADGTMIPSVSLPMCFEDQLTGNHKSIYNTPASLLNFPFIFNFRWFL